MKNIRSVTFWMLMFLFLTGCTATGPVLSKKELQARMDLATSYLLKGKPRMSLRYLLPIKEKAKDNTDFHFLLGLVYFQMKEFKLAKDEFKKAVDLSPAYAEAWNNLGLCYLKLQEIEKAELSFKKAMSIKTYLTPEYPAYNLARLYYLKKDLEKAKKYLQKSIEFNWRYIPAYILLSKIYEKEDNIQLCVKTLEKAREAMPDNVSVLLKLAESYLKEGNKKKAVILFKKIVKESPETDAAKVARDYLVILQ